MIASLSITSVILLFLVSGVIIWLLSNKLSEIVDYINDVFKLGTAFGGTLLLSVVVNLPELAIVVRGTISGDISIAIGNILGGIALQTVLLVLFDFASRKEKLPLTTITSNVNSISQGAFLVLILSLVMLGSQLDSMYVNFRFSPIEVLIAIAWVLSLLTLKHCEAANIIPTIEKPHFKPPKYSKYTALIYLLLLAVSILVFGYILAETSEIIAAHYHVSGIIFGATILAVITALPEISGGLEFVRTKNYNILISDIFGGNSFLPILFLIASIINDGSLLPMAGKGDLFLTSLSSILTMIFTLGMVIKAPKRFWGMGLDSWVALLIYMLSIYGLQFV